MPIHRSRAREFRPRPCRFGRRVGTIPDPTRGEAGMQLDSSDEQSMDSSNNGATRGVPTLEPLTVGEQSSMDGVSEAQTDNLPSLEPSQNREVAMQLNSSDHQSVDLSNNGQNVGTTEPHIIVVSSREEGTRKTQKKEHENVGVGIEVSFEDIRKCSKMSFSEAARKLQVGRSVLKHICRCYGIYCWPPRKIKMVRKICRGYGIYRWLPRKINMFRKINMVCYSRPLPVEDQEQIPSLPFDLPSDQASSFVGNIQDASMVTIMAKCASMPAIKFTLPLSSKLEDLKQEVARRLENLAAGPYYVQYKDEENELILMACDEDLQDCIRCARSLGNSTIVVLLVQGQPTTNLNPIDCVGNIQPGLLDASMVTIKAKCASMPTIKFTQPLSSKLEDLKQEVARRLENLAAGPYYVQYKDEEDELILMACDEDLQDCIRCARSLGNSTIVVLLVQGQPTTNLNPIDWVGNIQPGLLDASMVTIKAKCASMPTIKFTQPLLSKLEDLKQEVAMRLENLAAGPYYVQYKDEEDELILMACDEDLQDCIRCARSLGNSTIVVLLVQGQPTTNLNRIE